MQKVLEYEQHADACRRKAAETKSPQLKKQLEDMADVWERLALQRRQGINEGEPTPFASKIKPDTADRPNT